MITINKNRNLLGIIYPLPQYLIDRFFILNKIVFIKFPTHESISTNLLKCKKLIFYKSRGEWELVGEGEIDSIFLMPINDALNNFEKELFLSEHELIFYAKSRIIKKVLVFKLSNLKKYGKPITLDHYVTMAGEYISKEDYQRLIGSSGNKDDNIPTLMM